MSYAPPCSCSSLAPPAHIFKALGAFHHHAGFPKKSPWASEGVTLACQGGLTKYPKAALESAQNKLSTGAVLVTQGGLVALKLHSFRVNNR
eukprot:1149248-Pelagomonas_calceolata.AAC.7